MELRNLEYFVVLAEEQSFEKAARRLFLTQSAVSQQIRRLEADLGVRLIDRATRPFELTDAGRDVFALATSIVRQTQSIRGLAHDREGSAGGIVRVGVTPALLFSRVVDGLRLIRRDNPGLRIELFNDNTPQIQAQLESGALDVTFSNTFGSVDGCQDVLLYEDRLVVAFNPETYPHLVSGEDADGAMERAPLDALDGLPIISFARKSARANYDAMLGYFTEHGRSPALTEVVASYMDQVGYAKAGLGVALVPESLMSAVNVPNVSWVQLEPELPTIPIYATWNPDGLNRSGTVFMAELQRYFSTGGI
ncbi:LysR family transcriptional regulator [Brevibacterium sp. 50QC2O2]|jgi:DNA-binding transcriptional LysR family regulator|uniref:LysR family transcriptional regulator n=1 Tax=Brevibacterium sp. 50QC2O2 TaxID=2968459 RepID=UPI00211CB874|nr:LysR family transcriptional regulator [Brevibacterium sp. 50QC2O2]MCQ9388498.1 LysR family transcriptional regulator [Brevibacterium sp. 50QC2O2]